MVQGYAQRNPWRIAPTVKLFFAGPLDGRYNENYNKYEIREYRRQRVCRRRRFVEANSQTPCCSRLRPAESATNTRRATLPAACISDSPWVGSTARSPTVGVPRRRRMSPRIPTSCVCALPGSASCQTTTILYYSTAEYSESGIQNFDGF